MRAVLMVVLAAGCGDGITVPDATPGTDAPSGLVTVKLVSSEEADGHRVFFQNADSSLVLATRTGFEGSANAFMAPGGFATIEIGSDLFTWYDVQPGDVLTIGGGTPGLPGTATTLRLSAPLDPGQQFYQVDTACGTQDLGPDPTLTKIVQLDGCAPRQDLLVESYDPSFTLNRYLYEPDVSIDGSTHAMAGTYRALADWRIDVRGVRDGLVEMLATATLYDDGSLIFPSQRSISLTIANGTGSGSGTMFQPPGATVMTSVAASLFGSSGISTPRVISWGPEAATMVDVAALAPPAYTDEPIYVPGMHALRWAEDAPGVTPNVVLATFGWRDATQLVDYRWHVLAPRGAEAVLRLPHLPLAELTPGEGAQIIAPYLLTSIVAPGGYAALRTRLPVDWVPGNTWPADGPTGVVAMEQLGSVGVEGRH